MGYGVLQERASWFLIFLFWDQVVESSFEVFLFGYEAEFVCRWCKNLMEWVESDFIEVMVE